MSVDVYKDPRFAQCALKNPMRITELQKCPQCWKTATEFVDLLCSDKSNPCDCGTGPEPPPPEPKEPKEPKEPAEEAKSEGMSNGMKVGIGIAGLLLLGAVIVSVK